MNNSIEILKKGNRTLEKKVEDLTHENYELKQEGIKLTNKIIELEIENKRLKNKSDIGIFGIPGEGMAGLTAMQIAMNKMHLVSPIEIPNPISDAFDKALKNIRKEGNING